MSQLTSMIGINFMRLSELTLLSPSHHDSASSGLSRDRFGISFAAESIAAAAMHDGQYSRKLASVIDH